MIQKLSHELSEIWAAGGVVKAEDAEIFEYGMQLLLSSVINVLVVVLVSIIFRLPYAWIPFIAAFIPLRITAGGYHASTHILCILSFTGCFTLFLAIIQTISFISSEICLVVFAFISFIAVFILSPVQASNKPLTAKEAERNRKKSLVIAACFLMPAILSLFLPALRCKYLAAFYLGELAAAISLIVVKVGDRHAK